MMCPTHFLSIYRIFTKILLDMFSCENSIYCRKAAIRYKKDEFQTKSVFFDAINQGLLACLFDSHGNCHGHTNHGVVTCADETHHLYKFGGMNTFCKQTDIILLIISLRNVKAFSFVVTNGFVFFVLI